MTMQASEYRERLLAQGCEEGVADVVLALANAVRDDAVAEAIMKAGEQIGHSEQLLSERLNGHAEKNEGQFSAVMSTIRETASDLTATFERRFAELSERIGVLEGRIGKFEGLIGRLQGEIAELRGEIAELRGELAGQKGEIAAIEARLQASVNRAAFGLAALMIGLTGVVAGLAAAGVFG